MTMKRFLSLAMAVVMTFFLSSCGMARTLSRIVTGQIREARLEQAQTTTEHSQDDTDANRDNTANQTDLAERNLPDSSGGNKTNGSKRVENSNGLVFEISIPAMLIDDDAEEELKNNIDEGMYDYYKRNADGSITYGMTSEKQQELLAMYKESIDDMVKEMVESKDSSILAVKYTEDMSEFHVTVDPKKHTVMDTMTTSVFFTFGSMYQMFYYEDGEDAGVEVKYFDEGGRELNEDDFKDISEYLEDLFGND